MKKHEIIINEFYLSYIFNGDASCFDYSGNEEEQGLVDDFINELVQEYGRGHFAIQSDDDYIESEFTRCDVTGLYASCVALYYVY